MDVLPKNGELLAQVAIAFVEHGKALAGADAPLGPVVKGMGSAAADRDIVAPAVGNQHVAKAFQIGRDRGDVLTRPGVHFDHALGDFQLHFAEAVVVTQPGQQIGGRTRQVIVPQGHQLQFQLDAQREWAARGKRHSGKIAHPFFPEGGGSVSPALCKAYLQS